MCSAKALPRSPGWGCLAGKQLAALQGFVYEQYKHPFHEKVQSTQRCKHLSHSASCFLLGYTKSLQFVFHERHLLVLWFFDRSKIGIFRLLTNTPSHLVVVLAGLRGVHTLVSFQSNFCCFPPINFEGMCVAKAPLCLSETLL